jgi:hypothetical protein
MSYSYPLQLRNFLRVSAVEIEELVGWIGPAVQKRYNNENGGSCVGETAGDSVLPSYWYIPCINLKC